MLIGIMSTVMQLVSESASELAYIGHAMQS